MYYTDPTTHKFRCIRTTSQVENLNRRYNHLMAGRRQGQETADALTLNFMARSGLDQARRAGRGVDTGGVYDIALASNLHDCYPADQLPYPVLQQRLERARSALVELFGFKWQTQQIVDTVLAPDSTPGLEEQQVVADEDEPWALPGAAGKQARVGWVGSSCLTGTNACAGAPAEVEDEASAELEPGAALEQFDTWLLSLPVRLCVGWAGDFAFVQLHLQVDHVVYPIEHTPYCSSRGDPVPL
jgi:hypothetical protein